MRGRCATSLTMPKQKKTAAPVEPEKNKRRTIDLLPSDLVRLSALAAYYRKKHAPLAVNENEVIRLSLRDAAIALGLEQRTDVEPIEPAGGA